ncbi:MAG: hypothetical protein EOO07_03465 [Chitinophagaceae bacterium]|nr:MAG: hypothetical protein EOO07_03465 [Chitinophagaceae bacterium]
MLNFRLTQVRVPFAYNNLLKAAVFSLALFFSFGTYAQTYISDFANPAGNFSTMAPSGALCLAPSLTDGSNVADASQTNYTRISGAVGAALACDNPYYSIRAKLNFPSGTTFAPAGFNAGFRVQFSSVASIALLQSNIRLRTYLAGIPRETVTGASIANVALLQNTGIVPLSFVTTQTFDEVELELNTALIPITLFLDYRIYNAFGSISVLPVGFGNLSAKIQSGNLNVNWNTVSEKNNDRFIVQGSNDGKTWMDLGTVATKASGGNSTTAIDYSFSTPWSGTVMAGFGLLGLLLLPAVRSRFLKVVMLVLVMAAVVSCAKEKDGFNELEGSGTSQRPLYVRVAQIDKDGATTYSDAVTAKR